MEKHILSRIAACLMAVAVLVSCVCHAEPREAEAASKITLKSGAAAPSTIYAGHSYNLKVAGVKVKFTTSNKKVATIGATTGKLKALAPGTVKITAKNAKSGKAVASKTFTVLQRSKSVNLSSDSIYLAEPGDTAVIKPSLTPSTSTDVIRFATSDKTVATVGATSGKITAKGYGKAKITVYAKATKSTANSNKNNKVATLTVYVKKAPSSREKVLVYFDPGDIGVMKENAVFKCLNKGRMLTNLPDIFDIDMLVDDGYELVGWTRTPFMEDLGSYSHIDSINELVQEGETIYEDTTLYAVWKTKD